MRSHRLKAAPPPPPPRVAIYARVSSDQQAERQTIDSQPSELKASARRDGHEVQGGMLFIDNGHSGTTLIRPALERLRDMVALSAIDVIYVHAPDRLARSYAHQVLLLEEFARADARAVFLNRPTAAAAAGDVRRVREGEAAGAQPPRQAPPRGGGRRQRPVPRALRLPLRRPGGRRRRGTI